MLSIIGFFAHYELIKLFILNPSFLLTGPSTRLERRETLIYDNRYQMRRGTISPKILHVHQLRLRSDCAFVQTEQTFRCPLEDALFHIVPNEDSDQTAQKRRLI